MAYRFRANLYFDNDPASNLYSPGYAVWCSDQVNVRLGMAFHMNEGALNEEKTKHGKVDDFHWQADIFVPDSAQAVMDDFWAHIMSIAVRLVNRIIPAEDEESEDEVLPSYMEVHHCYHDTGGPCMPPHKTFTTGDPTPPENPCETSPAWTSQVWPANSYVKDDNKIWKAKESNTFTWIKPALTGDGAISWEFVKDCPL